MDANLLSELMIQILLRVYSVQVAVDVIFCDLLLKILSRLIISLVDKSRTELLGSVKKG